jgi:hypothetical protein
MDLFGFEKSDKELTLENASQIEGLKIVFDFISQEEELSLLNNIDESTWLFDLKDEFNTMATNMIIGLGK